MLPTSYLMTILEICYPFPPKPESYSNSIQLTSVTPNKLMFWGQTEVGSILSAILASKKLRTYINSRYFLATIDHSDSFILIQLFYGEFIV